MSGKTVILTHTLNGKKSTKITIGKWNEQQIRTFIDKVTTRKVNDECLCSFNVYNENHILSECGSTSFYENDFDSLDTNAEELEISIDPSLPAEEIYPWHGKCGAKSGNQCLENIQTGKCTSSVIRALVGRALFPKEY